MIKSTIIFVLYLTVIGCSSTITAKKIPDSEYYQLTNTSFDRFIISDKEALNNYTKIIFSPLKFNHLSIKSRDKKIANSWNFSTKDKVYYTTLLKDEIISVFASPNRDEDFVLGENKAKGTLYAEVRLLEFSPLVANYGETTSGTISRKAIESYGGLSIQILLVDSETNEFVAVLEDGRELAKVASTKIAVNKTTNSYLWKKTFNYWLKELRSDLTKIKNDSATPKT